MFLPLLFLPKVELSIAQANLVSDVETVVYAKNVKKVMFKRNLIYVTVVGLVVIVVTVTLSLVLSGRREDKGVDPRCLIPIEDMTHADVPIICMCRNTTKDFLDRLEPDEWEVYDYLKNLVQAEGIMDPDLEFEADSCLPENQYLVISANFKSYGRTKEQIFQGKPDSLFQVYAILMIYLRMGGVHWTRSEGWLEKTNVCSFTGVDCLFLRTTSVVSLPNNNLVGSIPSEIAYVTSLRTLDLSNNPGITGTIPPDVISKFRSLDVLDLSETSITGSIPSEVGLLTRLDELNLARSMLTGRIPTELGMLKVRHLGLSSNMLTGTIPDEMGNCSRLRMLRLQGNGLSGSVPESLVDLNDLGMCMCMFCEHNG